MGSYFIPKGTSGIFRKTNRRVNFSNTVERLNNLRLRQQVSTVTILFIVLHKCSLFSNGKFIFLSVYFVSLNVIANILSMKLCIL